MRSVQVLLLLSLLGGAPALAQDAAPGQAQGEAQAATQTNTVVFHIEGMT